MSFLYLRRITTQILSTQFPILDVINLHCSAQLNDMLTILSHTGPLF